MKLLICTSSQSILWWPLIDFLRRASLQSIFRSSVDSQIFQTSKVQSASHTMLAATHVRALTGIILSIVVLPYAPAGAFSPSIGSLSKFNNLRSTFSPSRFPRSLGPLERQTPAAASRASQNSLRCEARAMSPQSFSLLMSTFLFCRYQGSNITYIF